MVSPKPRVGIASDQSALTKIYCTRNPRSWLTLLIAEIASGGISREETEFDIWALRANDVLLASSSFV